jgi:hypothetical protein
VAGRACIVSFTDSSAITHRVEVSAESLYEAAALALAEFRRCGFTAAIPGPSTRLAIEIKEPATTHEVPIRKLRDWMESSARSPRERIIKDRLKVLLTAE